MIKKCYLIKLYNKEFKPLVSFEILKGYIITFIDKPKFSDFIDCPYLPGKKMRLEFMYLIDIDINEFDKLLENGWRRFGLFFFRPNCIDCIECQPIRIKVNEFKTTKSQRRIINKNKGTEVYFKDLEYKKELFDVYEEHSKNRFNQKSSIEDFKLSFFSKILPSKQSNFIIKMRFLLQVLLIFPAMQ